MVRILDGLDNMLDSQLSALKDECLRAEESALYTSTTFYIWLRCLRFTRATLWVLAALFSAIAAGVYTLGYDLPNPLLAALTLSGVGFPALVQALRINETIENYESAASEYKCLQGQFGRLARVNSFGGFDDFEEDSKQVFTKLDQARRMPLTPPEWCFRSAQRKIKSGDYEFKEFKIKGRD